MITISLNQIAAHYPCPSGWAKILHARGALSDAELARALDDENYLVELGVMGSGLEAVLAGTGLYEEQFPLADAFESNGLDDALWALRCLPEHDQLWRKFAVWCVRRVQHLALDQRLADVLDVAWRHSDGRATDAELEDALARASALAVVGTVAREAAGVAERETQTAKLRQILSAGYWVEDEE